jgi:hypothetical protein
MSVSYSGDIGATFANIGLYVIDTNGFYKGLLPRTATKTDYFSAGGISFAAGASLDPFKSNVLFADFEKTRLVTDNNLSSFQNNFSSAASKQKGATTGVTGTVSYSESFDPRATHVISVSSTSNSFSSAGLSHMDEIVFTARSLGANTGKTMQGFFGGFHNGITSGTTSDFLLLYPGTTGNAGITGFKGLTFAGSSLMAQHVKSGGTCSVVVFDELIPTLSVQDKLIDQAFSFVEGQNNLNGLTFGVDYGTSGKTATFPVFDSRGNQKLMDGLLITERLYTLSSLCLTQDSNKQRPGEIFFNFMGNESRSINQGITIDGISGGTNGSSELQHLIASLDAKFRTDTTTRDTVVNKFSGISSIRELVNIKF